MKNLMAFISTLILTSGVVLAGTPISTFVPVDHIYSPKGFDTNDNTEIIIAGYLPNLCHKSPMTSFKLKDNTINIKVEALKYDVSNPYCPEMIVPFIETVNVGMLDKGFYDIIVNGKTVFQKSAGIYVEEEDSNAIDDYVYANVEYIEKSANARQVILKGYNPSDCFILDEIKVVDNKLDTYSILPIMKQISDFCPMKMVPFSYEVNLPKTLKIAKVLLHVRVMDGESVNSLFPNYL